MEIRELRYFLAIAREQSISKAAEALYMTQPSLSRQMQNLEKELGKQLFVRGSKKIELTEAGFLLQKRAEEMLALYEKTQAELAAPEECAGEIRIGGGESFCVSFVARLATKMQRENPRVVFHFFSGDTQDVTEKRIFATSAKRHVGRSHAKGQSPRTKGAYHPAGSERKTAHPLPARRQKQGTFRLVFGRGGAGHQGDVQSAVQRFPARARGNGLCGGTGQDHQHDGRERAVFPSSGSSPRIHPCGGMEEKPDLFPPRAEIFTDAQRRTFPAIKKGSGNLPEPFQFAYSKDLYRAMMSSLVGSFGLPGRQASSMADCAKKSRSSSLTMFFRSAGIPTS